MDYSAPHMGYIYTSYALSAVVLIGLLVWVMARSKKLAAELAAKGLTDPGSKASS
jgi:heme exporter protein CcmD